jgi:hypothetical protein
VSKTSVEHVACDDNLNEDTKRRIKRFDEKLEGCLDDTNFVLQGEDGINLKMLVDFVWEDGINYMNDEGNTPTEEVYTEISLCSTQSRNQHTNPAGKLQ